MSNQLAISGTVKCIMETQTFESGFAKREFVVTTADQYPQDVKFEVVKDRITQLDNIQPGQTVNVSFNLRGNEYQGKYYTNLQAWRIATDTTPAQPAEPTGATGKPEAQEEDFPF